VTQGYSGKIHGFLFITMKIYDFMIIVTTHFHAFPNSFQSFSLPKSSLVDHRHHCSVETDDPEPSRMAETENTAAGLVFWTCPY
jgi:hypothetical protein